MGNYDAKIEHSPNFSVPRVGSMARYATITIVMYLVAYLFAIGITLASYAIIANSEQTLLISILPFIFNSSLILLNVFFFRNIARLIIKGNKLHAENRRSLLTLIAFYKPLTERKLVLTAVFIVAAFTFIAVFVRLTL